MDKQTADIIVELTEKHLASERRVHFLCDAILAVIILQLVILKLSGVIDWSWILILSPLYIPILIAAFIGISYLVVGGVFKGINKGKEDD